MIDPSLATGSVSNILQDAAITVQGTAKRLELKAGQFKTGQTYEGLQNSAISSSRRGDRVTRVFGDVRDRGAMLSWLVRKGPESFRAGCRWAFSTARGKIRGMRTQRRMWRAGRR